MSTWLVTLLFATAILTLSAIGIGIGRLLTGTKKFSCKRCGTPEKKECSLCNKKK